MNDDTELLRRYVEDRSEDAFTTLTQRRLGMVYGCALRWVGNDPQLAEDVAQNVFSDLARKARALSGYRCLSGWLYLSARRAAAEVVRRERRRKVREAQALLDVPGGSGMEPESDGKALGPLLDEVLLTMKASDREALVLRFLEQRPFADIAVTLNLSEDAARKRVERALEKLRRHLAGKGIRSSATALAAGLGAQAGAAVPGTLAATVSSAAMSASAGTVGLGATGMATLLGWLGSKYAAALVVLAGGAACLVWQSRVNAGLREDLARLPEPTRAIRELREGNRELARRVAKAGELRLRAEDEPLAAAPSNPPPPVAPVSPAAVPVPVTVTSAGTLLWAGRPVTLDESLQRLARLQTQDTEGTARVVIRGAPGSSFSSLAWVVEQASRADIRNIEVESQAVPNPTDNWITPQSVLPTARDATPPTLPDSASRP